MIVQLKSNKVQGIDVYVHRFQQHLEKYYPEYKHYPRLYKTAEGYAYYNGNKDYTPVIFSDKINTTGFYVENTQYIGNITTCDLYFICSIKQTQNDTRDDSFFIKEFRGILENTCQAKDVVLTEISRSDDLSEPKDMQPWVNLKMKMEITYIDSVTLKT